MAKWKKGQSGNLAGRPKSYCAADEIRKCVEKRGKGLVEEAFETLARIEDPQHRLNGILKLMEYIYPKPKEAEIPLEQAVEIVKRALEDRRTGSNPQATGTEKPTRVSAQETRI